MPIPNRIGVIGTDGAGGTVELPAAAWKSPARWAVTGGKQRMIDSKIESAKGLLANRVPPRDVAQNLGVSIPTLYRWIPAAA